MTDEEIHNIYLHMSGKAEGLVEANGTADFPVLFARAILEYEGMTKDVQNIASKSTYKEQLETKEYERGFIDGMQKQMQSSVDKAVNSMGKREWVGLTEDEIHECFEECCNLKVVDPKGGVRGSVNIFDVGMAIEAKLKEKNT